MLVSQLKHKFTEECQQSVCSAWLVPSTFSRCWTSVRLHLSTAMQCEWWEYFS